MTCTYGANVNVTIKLRASYGLQGNATAYSATDGSQSQTLFPNTITNPSGELIPSNDNSPLSLGSINCPPVVLDAAGTYMKITSTYDVYDKKGNLMRECTVENKLKAMNVNHGMEYTVTLTVAPTYLYVLSDEDLNNPTIKIN